jgi:hypothetical protein
MPHSFEKCGNSISAGPHFTPLPTISQGGRAAAKNAAGIAQSTANCGGFGSSARHRLAKLSLLEKGARFRNASGGPLQRSDRAH